MDKRVLEYQLRKWTAIMRVYGYRGWQMLIKRLMVALKPKKKQFSEVQAIFRLFAEHIAGKDLVIVDVGAHFGESALPFALYHWTVYGFEPDRRNYAVAVAALKRFSRVHLYPWAVSNEEKEKVPFYTSTESTGISSLSPFRASHTASSQVRVTSLANFFAREGIKHVDFLKIDTEGFDLFVLQGIPWELVAPTVILAEFDDRKTANLGYRFHDLVRYLLSHHYKLWVSEWQSLAYGEVHVWRGGARIFSRDFIGVMGKYYCHPPSFRFV